MDYSTIGKSPISTDAPCGNEARYEPAYEAVLNEIEKLSSPTASGQVDWALVAENGAVILKEKSKDLTIACYLCMALVVTRQVDGLDQGVVLLKEMIETFWENLFPVKRRMRGRVAAVQWWLERTDAELQKLQPHPLSVEQAQRIGTNLKEMDAFLGQNMPDAPVLRSLQRVVESWPVQQPQAPAEDKRDAAAAAPPAPGDTAPPASAQPKTAIPAATDKAISDDAMSGGIGDDAEARRAAEAAFQRLRQVSAFLIRKDLKNPLSYRYRRMAAWAKVVLPPANTDGNTQITSPPPQVIESLEALRTENNLEAMIQSAEPKLSQFIFWFDLNRFVAEALNDMGKDYQKALAAVCQETGVFLKRLPELETLRFADGTPFADAQTQQWLKRIAGGAEGGAMGQSTAAGSGAGDLFIAVLQKARSMARKKNLVEAITTLQQEMQQTESCGQKMRWRLAIARLLMDGKKSQLALPHLDQLVADIDTFQLEAWDPELAVEGLTAAWRGFSAQSGNEHKSRAGALLHRIARVDPAAALRLAP